MAPSDTAGPWTPLDTFGARLALIRQYLGGWNVKRAADHCGLEDATWRNWESGRTKPRDYAEVCRHIADAVGVDYAWLMVGGPLRSRCSWPQAFDLAVSA
jgi:transcriptional regulator with XRE-family HTH domain